MLQHARARDVADLAAFTYELDKPTTAALRHRLSSMLYARQATIQQLRNLLPIGILTGIPPLPRSSVLRPGLRL